MFCLTRAFLLHGLKFKLISLPPSICGTGYGWGVELPYSYGKIVHKISWNVKFMIVIAY